MDAAKGHYSYVVGTLILIHRLNRTFARRLHKSVRPDFRTLVDRAKQN